MEIDFQINFTAEMTVGDNNMPILRIYGCDYGKDYEMKKVHVGTMIGKNGFELFERIMNNYSDTKSVEVLRPFFCKEGEVVQG